MRVTRLSFRLALGLLLLPLAAGQSCSSDPDNEIDTAALLASCEDTGAAQCSYLAACLPISFSATFGDVGTCTTRTRLTCAWLAKWQGTGWTVARLDQCTAQVKQATCDGTTALGSGPCANPPGSLADGASCFDSSQCATGFCNRLAAPSTTVPANCGTCTAGGCLAGSCKANEICLASSAGGRCVEMLTEGTACTAASICGPGLTCLGSVCAKSRGEGEPCTGVADCDALQELTCVDRTCRKPMLVDPGAACSSAVRCAGGAQCQNVPLPSSLTCVAALADGSACTATGAPCTAPARCAGGTCKVPADLTCP